MCKTKLWVIGALVGIIVAAAMSSKSNAQGAPVPVRVPPPPPSVGQAQPTTAQTTQAQAPAGAQQASPATGTVTVTIHCAVGGISTSLFSTSGLRCPSPIHAGLCDYVIMEGWGAVTTTQADGPVPRDITFTTDQATIADVAALPRNSDWIAGIYRGVSVEPGGNVTFRYGTVVLITNFGTAAAGFVPRDLDFIVKGALPCL
jgi:hypothetical protein